MTLAPVATTPTAVATFRTAEQLEARPTAARAQTWAAQLLPYLPSAIVAITCAWWLVVVPRWWGGRGPGAVAGGAILTALAIVAIRPDRCLPARVIGLASAVSIGAFLVALTAPTGWSGATTGASYVCAAWTVVVVAAAVARDRRFYDVVVALVVVGVLVEMAEAWLSWWGGADASKAITGTFYWWDPFAAYLIAGTGIGLALWLKRSASVALLGLTACALGCVGVVYSTSRAAMACLAGVLLLVGVTHLIAQRLTGLKRLGIAAGVTALAVWGVAGPPFFPHRVTPLAGTSARSSGQSLGQNGGYRLEFWHEAVNVFTRHPLTGGGFHSLATLSVGHVPTDWAISPLAHNGYLQALSDGGLILGVPFLLAIVGLVWLVGAALLRAVRDRTFGLAAFVVPLCLGAMLAHSAVDFDWSYAADFALVAVVAGLVVGSWAQSKASSEPVGDSRRTRPVWWVSALVLVGVVLTGVAAQASWSGDIRQSLPVSNAANHGGAQ